MAVDYRHGLSILELIVYLPSLFISLFMGFRHGFQRNAGWVLLIIFSLARIVGSCCYLATIAHPETINLYIAWGVCTSIGLAPLISTCIGLLSRMNDSIQRKTGRGLLPAFFRLVGLLTLAGMILCIVGASESSSLQGITNSTEAKIGDVLYVISWGCLCLLLLVIGSKYESIEDGEHRLLLAVGLSVPLLLVRLIYSLLSVFTHNPTFNMLTGNVTVFLVMAVLEEIVIVVICLGVGMTLEVRQRPTEYEAPAQGDPELGSRQSPGRMSYNSGKQERRRKRRRGGPISQLIGLAIDEIRSRRQ
ncbi:hypothetical protein AbraIFM66951_003488 [Aspergillus brasiliensis]|uniref:DUF7702 domain-containing protein n=2 Tax=Aspergillus brasiliensis TaxID=319629 RepID=A0A1L9UHF5_ASPBC|nr:hypothetical protein ASPBRDRAFT_75747 [Aspergillus brasiliensis CBS 101740]GKZ25248.1 hypothetical protein AbraCBS73388_000709 [Aspergillus brasiliensis]GKZ50352.1 hypothetical protein AbraIFM66951_003488 [Aspergillus brasiliensis]